MWFPEQEIFFEKPVALNLAKPPPLIKDFPHGRILWNSPPTEARDQTGNDRRRHRCAQQLSQAARRNSERREFRDASDWEYEAHSFFRDETERSAKEIGRAHV